MISVLVASQPTRNRLHRLKRAVGTVDRFLCDRVGGSDAITPVTRAFEDRAGEDDRINQKFAGTNFDRLTKEFVDQLCHP